MPSCQQSLRGADRRRHRVYVTRNTEYHFRDQLCVAVRDRKSGNWLHAHLARGRQLSGGVRFNQHGFAVPCVEQPRIGDALFFGTSGRELVTSVLTSVERPEKAIVSAYQG